MANNDWINLGIMVTCGLAGALGWFRWFWGFLGGLLVGIAVLVGIKMYSGQV